VVAAAAPWSRENHALFPAHVRARAAELLRLGQLLVREARFAGEEVALLDVWPLVMAHALSRDDDDEDYEDEDEDEGDEDDEDEDEEDDEAQYAAQVTPSRLVRAGHA